MIKKKHKFNKKTMFGRERIDTKLDIPMISHGEKRWKSIVNLNCKSGEFNDINGIDFFYRVFHHSRKNKNKLKAIIENINNNNNGEKMMTGNHLVKFTPVIYKLTKKMIKGNTKEYRKFQKENNGFNKKDFRNWWSVAHNSDNSHKGIGKIILDLRKFWAVFFSSFKNFKNFENFEKRILAGNDKLSTKYTKYVKKLTIYGVPKFIDPQLITNSDNNNVKVFTDFSVFSELWRLSKPIFCTYRTLFIKCNSGIEETNNCPFNSWGDFDFDKLAEEDFGPVIEHIGDLTLQNKQNSIVGYINTGYDWSQDEMNRMFERDNPTNRARLLETAKSVAQQSKHSHGINGSYDHTHPNNPVYNNSERFLKDKIRSDSQMLNANRRIYAKNGVNIDDHDLENVLASNSKQIRNLNGPNKSKSRF